MGKSREVVFRMTMTMTLTGSTNDTDDAIIESIRTSWRARVEASQHLKIEEMRIQKISEKELTD